MTDKKIPRRGIFLCLAVTSALRAELPRRVSRGSAALISMRLLSSYQNNNLSRHEVPLAVEHPRDTEKPPGTPSGRNSERLLWRMKRGISTAAVRERKNSASRSVSGERQRGYQRLDDVWSVYSPFSRGSLTREREGGGCKNFSFTVLRLFFWLQKKRGKYRPADESTEEKSAYGARNAVKPAGGGLPSSVTAQCQGTAPCHLPQRGRLWRLSRSRL